MSIGAFLGLIGAAIVAIVGAFGFGHQVGRKAERQKADTAATQSALETQRRIDDAVDGGADAGADRDWLRKFGKGQ